VVASHPNDFPDFEGAEEIAVIGRSNVGKSTLLNSLLGFKGHIHRATISPKPGETKNLSFYAISGKTVEDISLTEKLVVVDMPGYGFAYMSEEEAARCSRLVKP